VLTIYTLENNSTEKLLSQKAPKLNSASQTELDFKSEECDVDTDENHQSGQHFLGVLASIKQPSFLWLLSAHPVKHHH